MICLCVEHQQWQSTHGYFRAGSMGWYASLVEEQLVALLQVIRCVEICDAGLSVGRIPGWPFSSMQYGASNLHFDRELPSKYRDTPKWQGENRIYRSLCKKNGILCEQTVQATNVKLSTQKLPPCVRK